MELTEIQERILSFIEERVREKGIPPSIKEIGSSVGLSSSSSVHHQLQNIERLGYIRRDKTKSRSIELLRGSTSLPRSPESVETVAPSPQSDRESETTAPLSSATPPAHDRRLGEYPLVRFDAENGFSPFCASTIALPTDFVGYPDAYLIAMEGDAMKEGGILDGDLCVVKHAEEAMEGDIIVAKVEEGIVIRTYRSRGGYPVLEPQNARMRPMMAREALIVGKVIGVMRHLEGKYPCPAQEIP
ncbi:MAG: S24 family peptidase [Candidatus Eremiobacteraeota bacterium]|nr:S24 family peptidase [Candidatus Eremiobacteraeota bacterium]